MFCPKCGTAFEDGSLKCEKCGYEIVNAPEPVDHSEPPVPNSAPLDEKKSKASLKRFSVPQIVLFVMAALILIISLYAAGRVVSGGMSISSIESVGGRTLEEAYYQALGTVYAGYAAAIRAMGFFFASVLAYLGYKG